jgi:predicted NBD/HSP70 family sugar kinase
MIGPSSGSGPHVLRKLNATAVLLALRAEGTLRIADLMERTGLTRPTVALALAQLERSGWIETVPDFAEGVRRKGRPAQLVRFRAGAGYLVGVDVGPHTVSVMVTDLNGTALTERRTDARDATGGAELMAHVTAEVRESLEAAGAEPDRVRAVCVGSPGVIDPVRATVNLAPSIPGWADMPLGEELGKLICGPVRVENDVNLSVLAERWQGVGTDVDTLMYVHWGTRVGAGLLVGGRLHRGAAAAAGEIGFMDLGEATPSAPPTSGMGPFESAVGSAAIAELAEEALRGRRSRLAGADSLTSSAICAAADAGDEVALAVVDEIGARFARGLAPALLILDPDLVVIGGGVSRGGPVLLAAVRRHLETRTLVPPRLALSTLGDRAAVVGAVRLCMDELDVHLQSLEPA